MKKIFINSQGICGCCQYVFFLWYTSKEKKFVDANKRVDEKKSRRRKARNVTCMQIVATSLRQTSIHLIYVKNYFRKKSMTSRSHIIKKRIYVEC